MKAQKKNASVRANRREERLSGGHLPKKGFPSGVTLEELQEEDLTIKKIETSKDLIKQPRLAADERKIIPSLGNSVVINGKSGSGKSTLLTNLITNPRFFGKCEEKPEGWFDKIFLFSPTADGDDVQKELGIPKNHVFTDLDEGPELLQVILDSQKEKLSGGGKAHTSPQYAVIFDDVIGETQFMNTKQFLQAFYMVRHRNCTTFICSQHYKRVPKVCRQQASFIFFFAGSAAEVEQVIEDFAPPFYTRNEFRELVQEATRGEYSFLTICMKVGWDLRFRRNLNGFIKLDRLTADDAPESKEQEHPLASDGAHKTTSSQHARICDDSDNAFKRNLADLVKFFKQRNEHHEQASAFLGER